MLWKHKGHDVYHESSSLDPVMSQLNSVQLSVFQVIYSRAVFKHAAHLFPCRATFIANLKLLI
jgi:hypothetical protein